MKKFWRCKICGDLHWGVSFPSPCPTCGFKNSYYEVKKIRVWYLFFKIAGKKFWRCYVCNDLHFGKHGPSLCPTCKHKEAYVEISEKEFKTILDL